MSVKLAPNSQPAPPAQKPPSDFKRGCLIGLGIVVGLFLGIQACALLYIIGSASTP